MTGDRDDDEDEDKGFLRVEFRGTPAQKARWQAAANHARRKLAAWVAIVCDEAAERELAPETVVATTTTGIRARPTTARRKRKPGRGRPPR